MALNLKEYNFEEIAKHNSTKDCWIIIHGKVYDVSEFMEKHPGGDEVLLASTGKDATSDYEDIGHSDSAKEMMEKYCIGKINMSTLPVRRAHVRVTTAKEENSDRTVGKILSLFVPLLILVLAYGVREYLTQK